MIKFLTSLFSNGRSNFTEFETFILQNVREALTEPLQFLWDKQLLGVNKIQDEIGGLTVNLYRMVKGKSSIDPNVAFPVSKDEFVFRKVSIDILGQNEIIVKLWIVQGYFFSMDFSRNPLDYTEAFASGFLTDGEINISIECFNSFFC